MCLDSKGMAQTVEAGDEGALEDLHSDQHFTNFCKYEASSTGQKENNYCSAE